MGIDFHEVLNTAYKLLKSTWYIFLIVGMMKGGQMYHRYFRKRL